MQPEQPDSTEHPGDETWPWLVWYLALLFLFLKLSGLA